MVRALVALATADVVLTGVALATPVPVLRISDGSHEFLGADEKTKEFASESKTGPSHGVRAR